MFPIHLNLGFRVFYYYEGLYFFIAILVATLVAVRRQKKAGLDANVFLDGLLWILLGSFLGARIFHFVFWDLTSLLENPFSFFHFWEGGMSITGGLAGGVLAAWFCLRKTEPWRYFAETIPAVLLGQAIGRFGCFLNGDAWGIPTNLPWGISLPKFGTFVPSFTRDTSMASDAWTWSVTQGFTDPLSTRTVPLHPAQLYEAFGDLLLMGLSILMVRSARRTDGPWQRVNWFFLGGYALLRFSLEFLHGDHEPPSWWGMTGLQVGLLAFTVIAGALYFASPRRA
jgi:phosphatidylglycerol---prolipoprotein diacylglyceryl transferase